MLSECQTMILTLHVNISLTLTIRLKMSSQTCLHPIQARSQMLCLALIQESDQEARSSDLKCLLLILWISSQWSSHKE